MIASADDGPSTLTICLVASLVPFVSCFLCCTVAIRRSNARYRRFNDEEWHIVGLPSVAAPIQGCNAVGCGCVPSCAAAVILFLVDKLAVRPALRRSQLQMEEAEKTGRVDPVLCSKGARKQMANRIDEFYGDIRSSQTLSLISKVLNYAGAAHCLANHRGLLERGMAMEVSAETVVDPVFIVSLPRTATTILHRTMSLDRSRWRSFDMCDMVCPLEPPVPRDDLEGRKKLSERAAREFGAISALFPGWLECMETMHGFRFGEAEEDLGWYDTSLGHMYFDVLILMYPEQRAKPGGISHLESAECAEYRYAWLDMIMRIYQHTDSRYNRPKGNVSTKAYGSMPSTPVLPPAPGLFSRMKKKVARHDDSSEADSLTYSVDYQREHSVSIRSGLGAGETPFFLRSFRSMSLGCRSTSLGKHKEAADATDEERGKQYKDTRPWLMKDPNHSAFLPQLIAQFPDAKLIFTHRAPGDLVASLAKTFVCFACVQHVPGARGTKSEEWGEEALKRTEHFCDGLVDFAKKNEGTPLGLVPGGSSRRVDFLFEDLVKVMPASISKIYSRFFPDRPPPTADAMDAFKSYLEENERQKRGNQRRSLEDFHLSREQVAFSEYTDMFLANR